MKYQEYLKRFTVVPELLSLSTNVKNLIPGLSVGAFICKIFDWPTKLNFVFKIVNDIKKPAELNKKFEFFWGKNNNKRLYYERPFWGRIKFKMLIEKNGSDFFFLVNRFYFEHIRFQLGTIWLPGTCLLNTVIFSLLNLDYLVLHSACISKNDRGILLISSSTGGKSLTAYSSLKKGYKLLSEDVLVLNPKDNYANSLISYTPQYLSQINKHKTKPSSFDRFSILTLFSSIFSLMFRRDYVSSKLFRKFFSSGRLIDKTKINKICILEKGEDKIIKLNKVEALKKVLAINRARFDYYNDTSLRAFSYFNPEMDIEVINKKEEEALFSVIKQSECYLFQADDPARFVDYIERI